MRSHRDKDGRLWLVDLPAACADTLSQVPAWLESEDPVLRTRLLPAVYTSPEEEEQWRRHGAPDLLHLFASRLEILRKDLETLQAGTKSTYRLCIPKGHETAWLASLNAARLALFFENGLTEADMNSDFDEVRDPRKLDALIRISLLAWVQQILIEAGA
jgi:hypothetical protein